MWNISTSKWKPESSCRSFEIRGFHVQTRPERCIFHGSHSELVSEIHPLSVPREDISIHLSPIRAVISPTNFHQVTQTGNRDSRKLRISDKHGEIHIHPCTGHRIPGNHRGLHKYDVSPPRRESSCNPEGVSSLGKLTSSFSKSALSYNREVNLLRNRSSSGSLTLSGDLTFEKQQHSLPACQQCRYSSGSPCSRGSKLVGRQSSPRKWAPHSELPTTLVIQSDASNLGGGHGQRRKPIFTWIAKSY